MKLVFVIKSLEGHGGGAERVLVDIANGLVARGHAVTVVTFDRPGAPTFYTLDPRVTRIGVAIGGPGLPTPRLKFLAGLSRLRRAVATEVPEVVVGFMHSTYVPLALATIGGGLRMIASEHVGLVHFHGRRMQRWLVRATNPCFLGKTVPTACLRSEFPESERCKISVLPNPVHLENFSIARTAVEGHPPMLLCVGGFRDEKDHATLLEAFASIADAFPEWTLRLVGDGVLRGKLEAQITRLGLECRVEMPGMSANVAAEYAQAAVVVVPSRYESFGLVAVEALASARPVIGFADALGPLGVAIDGQNAVLVDGAGDRVASLAAGLRALMEDEALRRRLGRDGPGSVQCFAREAVVDQWEAYLRRCVDAV